MGEKYDGGEGVFYGGSHATVPTSLERDENGSSATRSSANACLEEATGGPNLGTRPDGWVVHLD